MTEQTPMTEDQLEQIEGWSKFILESKWATNIIRRIADEELRLVTEVRRLRELNERLKEGYKKILEYPLTGAEYADIAEAMRYRQIARTALQEVGELEKGQTTNDPAGDE